MGDFKTTSSPDSILETSDDSSDSFSKTLYVSATTPNCLETSEESENFDMDDAFYEFIIFMIPCFVFTLVALKRLSSLNNQPLPQLPIYKQPSFVIKRLLSLYQAVIYVLQLFLASVLSPDLYWITEYKYGAITYLFGIVAWILSYLLLEKEGERGIYQRMYSHRMFWTLDFIATCIRVSIPMERQPVPLMLNIAKLTGGFYLALYAIGKPFDSAAADELNGRTNRVPLIRTILLKIENTSCVKSLLGEKPHLKSEPLLLFSVPESENEEYTKNFKTFLKKHDIGSTTSAQAGDWLKYLPIVTCHISPNLVTREDDPEKSYYEIKTNVDDEIYTKLHEYSEFLLLETHIKKRYNPLRVNWIDRDPPEFAKLEASQFPNEQSFIEARRETLERYLNTLGTDPRYMNDKVLEFLGIQDPHKSSFMKYFAYLATRYSKKVPLRDSFPSMEMEDLSRSPAHSEMIEGFVPKIKVRCSNFQKAIYGDYYEYIFVVFDERDPENYWSVTRSYKDFKELNEKLEKIANKPIPYLDQFVPKPRYQRDTTDLGFVNERKKGLDMYINVILKQPAYHTNILYEFLEYDLKKGTHKSKNRSPKISNFGRNAQ